MQAESSRRSKRAAALVAASAACALAVAVVLAFALAASPLVPDALAADATPATDSAGATADGTRLAFAGATDLRAAAEDAFFEKVAFEPADGSDPIEVDCRFAIVGTNSVEVCGTGTLTGSRAVDAGLAGKLTIPPAIAHNDNTYTITRIGDYAFGGTKASACTGLSEVELPDTVTAIGDYAFANCSGLQALALPANLTSLGHHAFYYCTGIPSVRIPASVSSMGDYAFCQSNGLRTVTFEGDATVAGAYAFTGGTTIETVAFHGKALPYETIKQKANGYFNSESVDRPTYYYGISFYANQEDRLFEENRIAFAVVSEKAKFKDICEGLDANGGLLEGEVPAWPEGTNLWRFDGVTQMAATPTDSVAAYALFSTYRNLARGSVSMDNVNYTGETFDPTERLYVAHPQIPNRLILVQPKRTMLVYDSNGTELDPGVDFTVAYYRRNDAGEWVATDDLVNPGEIRAVITGAGRYEGTTNATFSIEFGPGVTFATDIPAGDGTDRTVQCAFRVNALTDEGGTVSVAPKEQTKREATDGLRQRAVPIETQGELTIPKRIEVLGRVLDVVGVADEAFGASSPERVCASLASITLPAGIESIGASAFGNCSSLEKVVFQGDVYGTRFGSRAFTGCPLQQVVFFGKKPNDARYSMTTLFPSAPHFFYTLRFYGSKTAYDAGADPLGSVTLRDDFKLAGVPDKPTDPAFVYAGAVPDYPTYYIDDHGNAKRHWYAPAWFFGEADDNRVALENPLEDSTFAYAAQMQDAFNIDDAIVYGVRDSYEYTGSPVVSADDIVVYSGLGGTLARDVDYQVSFERIDDDLNWSETDDLVSGGELRLVLRGLGDYASDTSVFAKTFKIVTHPSRVGTIFTYDVPLTAGDEQATATCRFIVTSLGEGRSCSVHPESSNSPAVSWGTAGDLVIPEYVECMGVPYRVTGVEDNAFKDCSALTGIQLPASVASIGASSFFNCRSLASMELPAGIQAIPQNAFNSCGSLRSITLPEGVTSIGNWGFYDCRSLEDINLPDSLEELGLNCFMNCSSINALKVPAHLAATSTAFAATGVRSLTFAEGTETIAAGAFIGCRRLESIELPDTVVRIGTNAFASSAISYLSVPASVAEIGKRAFASCNVLAEVVFEGDASAIDMEDAFAGASALSAIVFRGTPPYSLQAVFPSAGSGCRYYSNILFYESPEAYAAGMPSGVAAVQHGVRLRSVKAGLLADDQIYDGAVPALPEGATCWSFDGGAALSETVSHTMDATASDADPFDLSAGCIVTSVSYRYTSSTIDPFAAGSAAGTGFVMSATGEFLTRGIHFTLAYQRKNANGEWVDSANKASRGTIRVVATAIPGSGYTGSVCGYYSIADYLPGDTFTADDGNGHLVTYRIIEPGTSVTPGKAAVGTGGTAGTAGNYENAVSNTASGAIALPDVVSDPRGNLFEVTEIAPYAFYRCMNVTEVAIPKGVRYVGTKAFAYERIKTDVRTSNIARVHFRNDMTQTLVASDAFLGCDMVSTVVYGQKKGVFEELHPFELAPGVNLVRYYTARFYPSVEDMRAGDNIVATVVAKEGAYLYSPSLSDYLAGSDRIPFPDETHEWAYDEASTDDDGRLADSMNVYGYEIVDNTIQVNVPVEAAGVTTEVPCAFTVLAEPSGEGTEAVNGRVSVGTMRDGHPCVETAVTGRLVIPETVEHLGGHYDVVEIGAYAFGSSDEGANVARISAVSVPASATSIEQAAFMNCASLAAVDFAEGSQLANVGAAAFLGCTALDHIELPNSVTAVRTAAFESTGLRRVVLPASCMALNRRAFNGCVSLREVVFAGPSHLDLPVLAGIEDLPAYSYPDAPEKLALASIDDYAFAGCTALERVVFEADASELVVSEVAFPDSAKLAAVVFGASRCDTAPFALGGGADAPVFYYTIVFNDDEAGAAGQTGAADQPAGDAGDGQASSSGQAGAGSDGQASSSGKADASASRLGYLCVPAETVYAQFDPERAYAGAVPALPEHHEWVAAFDVESPLDDSSVIGMRRIRYAISTNGNDAAVLIAVTVSGSPATEAGLGDEVSVSVTTQGGVEPIGFSVLDTATGDKVAVCSSPAGTFTMPGAAVNIRASYKRDIVVEAQRALFGDPTEERVLTLDEVRDAAAKANPQGEARLYSAWDVYREPQITIVKEWIGIPELVEAAGFRFDEGDSLIVETEDGTTASISYSSLYPTINDAYDRRYYPGILADEQEDAVAVLPCIAIRSSSYSPAFQLLPQNVSLADCYRLCYGQRPREFANIVNTFSNQLGNIVRLTVLYGPEDVAGCTAEGLPEDGYDYTGARVLPQPRIFDVDGREMRANTDYQISYGENIEGGTGTFTIEGMGLYTGQKEFSFKINRDEPEQSAEPPKDDESQKSGESAKDDKPAESDKPAAVEKETPRADSIARASKAALMAAVARDAYPNGSRGAVVVATKDYSVALSAAALAGALDYPVLFTANNALTKRTAKALTALRSSDDFEIVVVGGKSSVSKKLLRALSRYVPNANYIQTLVGTDRFAQSRSIYDYGRDLRLWSNQAVVVSAKDFANAVSVLPYAVSHRAPILLCNGKKTPQRLVEGAKKKAISRVVVAGSKKAVKKSVVKRAKKLVGASKVKRLVGANRYSACASINTFALKTGSQLGGAVIAAGTSSPSMLAGSILAGKRGSVVMIAKAKDMRTLTALKKGASSVLRISFVGKASSIPKSVRNKAVSHLGWSKAALK